MSRRDGLATVIRLAVLRERQALGDLARAIQSADPVRSELRSLENRRSFAMRETSPPPGAMVFADTIARANDRVRAFAALATEVRPRLEEAEREVERVREKAASERLRTRALENVRDRRERVRRMEQRRREVRRVDELLRAPRNGGLDDA